MRKSCSILLPFLLFFLPQFLLLSSVKGQTLYDPQVLYDSSGGLFETDSLRTLYITFYDQDYDSILDTNWLLNTNLRLPATVQTSNGIFLDSVGVRYKGNSTYTIPRNLNNPKLPLNLDMNHFIGGQKLMDYKKLKVANAMFDPTFVKEISAYHLYRRYLPSPEANLMKVYVQGNYLGLYINTESVDKQFLKKHFDEKDGILFKCDPIQQFGQPGPTGNADLTWLGPDTTLYYNHYDLKSDYGWSELVNLIDILNNNPQMLDSVLNIDRVLWAFAVNTTLANLDTYNGLYQHNYYLYQTQDGLFQMIPWDLSESFVGALLGHNPNATALYEYDPFGGYNCWWYPLVAQLISDPSSHYGKIYTAHLRTILNESLDANAIYNYAIYLQTIGLNAATTDPNKLFGMAAFTSNVTSEFIIPNTFSTAGITSTVNLRKPYLQSLPALNLPAPAIPAVGMFSQNGDVYITATATLANTVELMTTNSPYNSKFISTLMYDDGTNGDLVSGDQVYTAYLPFQNNGLDVKYYIRATNTLATQLNPERAEYEFYLYTPTLVGLNEDQLKPSLHIFPNPTQSFLFIETTVPGKLNWELFSLHGELVAADSGFGSQIRLDLSVLPAGVYVLRVNGASYKVVRMGD